MNEHHQMTINRMINYVQGLLLKAENIDQIYDLEDDLASLRDIKTMLKGDNTPQPDQHCTYPGCQCPFDMGAEFFCLKGRKQHPDQVRDTQTSAALPRLWDTTVQTIVAAANARDLKDDDPISIGIWDQSVTPQRFEAVIRYDVGDFRKLNDTGADDPNRQQGAVPPDLAEKIADGLFDLCSSSTRKVYRIQFMSGHSGNEQGCGGLDKKALTLWLEGQIGKLFKQQGGLKWCCQNCENNAENTANPGNVCDECAEQKSGAPDYWPTPEMVLAYNTYGTDYPRSLLPKGPPRNLDVDAFRAAIRAAPRPDKWLKKNSFQSRVEPWLMECFGEMIAGDREERNHRFLEEALELVQACNCTADEAHKLVDYVYGRDVGNPAQEVGGVMVTLAALCLANGMDMHDAAETELARISHPETVEKIREKQKRKPSMSPLPGVYPERVNPPETPGP